MKKFTKKYKGITLVELIVVSAISVITVLAVVSLMADSQRGFNSIYEKAHSDLAQSEFVIRKVFSSVIRPASGSDTATILGSNDEWLQVQYYSSLSVSSPDRYAKFYLYDEQLFLEKGIDPGQTLSIQTIAANVTFLKFKKIGTSIQMYVKLDDQNQTREILTSAIMKNP